MSVNKAVIAYKIMAEDNMLCAISKLINADIIACKVVVKDNMLYNASKLMTASVNIARDNEGVASMLCDVNASKVIITGIDMHRLMTLMSMGLCIY